MPITLDKIVIILAALTFGTISTEEIPVKAEHPKIIYEENNIKINKKYNDIAMFLAGINLKEDSGLQDLTKNPAWNEYYNISKDSWLRFYQKKNKIQKWARKEISDALEEETVFYPFSGPDILYANLFFPNAKKYIMFGLERVGTIPKLEKDSLKPYLDSLSLSLKDILNLSFFMSKDMNYELNNKEINGVIPILLLFLARTNNEIVDIKPVEIDNDGINYLNDFVSKRGRGVEIYFKNKNKKDIQELYYFSADLSNRSLLNKKIKLYFENMEGVVTYIKSASYLMHNSYFSTIRDIILNKSNFILQDDSGIPFHDFDKEWKIDLYGTYTGPIELFKDKLQEDLKAAYENSKALDFRIGYGKNSNLLVARKIHL